MRSCSQYFFKRMSAQPIQETPPEARSVNSEQWFRALGVLPLLFFCAQGIHYWRINQLGHMLWMCNIGNLLLALALFLNRPELIQAAAIWTIPGLVMWLLLVVRQWGVVLASVLAHVGGLAVGLVAIRRVGVDQRAWIYALIWYFVIQVISCLTTPVDFNVNVSQAMYPGWDRTFHAYWQFWLVMTLLVALMLWLISVALRRVWPLVRETRRS